jgi:hypothetical protein
MKDKKARKDVQKEKKKVMDAQNQALLEARTRAEMDGAEESEKEEMEGMDQKQETLYEDEATVSMFGSAVSVSVQSQLDDAWFGNSSMLNEEENNSSAEDSDQEGSVSKQSVISTYSGKGKKHKPEPTKLERALKKAGSLMNKKKGKRDNYKRNLNSRDVKKKIDSSKLLDKAMGRLHGKNRGKGRR